MASILARLRVKPAAEVAFERLFRAAHAAAVPGTPEIGSTLATAPSTALPAWWGDRRGSD